jgi:hypothetical protein
MKRPYLDVTQRDSIIIGSMGGAILHLNLMLKILIRELFKKLK